MGETIEVNEGPMQGRKGTMQKSRKCMQMRNLQNLAESLRKKALLGALFEVFSVSCCCPLRVGTQWSGGLCQLTADVATE